MRNRFSFPIGGIVAGVVFAAILGASSLPAANAAVSQFGPPATVFGSVTDQAGAVAPNLPVTAYIGNIVCGSKGTTEYTGDGAARVTVYYVDVVSAEQTPGCGKDGVEVRIKIGDRFAAQTTHWKAGPVQLDVTFGNVTPAPIPTFTPAPTRTPAPATATLPAGRTATQHPGTIPAGSPGAGSPYPTLAGGSITSTAAAATSASGGGGFPVWGIVVIGLAVVAAAGAGVGYAMSRNRGGGDDDYPGDPPGAPPLP